MSMVACRSPKSRGACSTRAVPVTIFSFFLCLPPLRQRGEKSKGRREGIGVKKQGCLCLSLKGGRQKNRKGIGVAVAD